MAHVSGLRRLVEDRPSLSPISRAPVSLPYNRRVKQERVFALSNTGYDFVELRYDQSHYLPSTSLPSTSSPFVSFSKEGGCEMFGGGDCRGCGLTPLKVMQPSCSSGGSGREMVMVEEQQMTQSKGGEKVEREVENDIAPWEESCLAKFSEFLGFPT